MIERWREIPTPKYKGEYEGNYLLLRENPPRKPITYQSPYEKKFEPPDMTDTVVRIERRFNAKDSGNSWGDASWMGNIRVLRLGWYCNYCNAAHQSYIPESWLDEGKAVFVEKVTEEV